MHDSEPWLLGLMSKGFHNKAVGVQDQGAAHAQRPGQALVVAMSGSNPANKSESRENFRVEKAFWRDVAGIIFVEMAGCTWGIDEGERYIDCDFTTAYDDSDNDNGDEDDDEHDSRGDNDADDYIDEDDKDEDEDDKTYKRR